MAIKGAQVPLGATDTGARPGSFALGSAQSRAAARAILIAKLEGERDKPGVQFVCRADGSVAEIRGLAEAIRAARMNTQAGVLTTPHLAVDGCENSREGSWEKCLQERIQKARARVA